MVRHSELAFLAPGGGINNKFPSSVTAQADRDILIAACLLHDVGRQEELKSGTDHALLGQLRDSLELGRDKLEQQNLHLGGGA